ncbi:hypothetical protein ACTG9Q_28210 [Actinokineospora sp. 24-640]
MSTVTALDQQRDSIDTSSLSRYHDHMPSWPTTIEPVTGEVRLRLGDIVDALVMSAGFGGEVNHHLVQAMISPPIIGVRGEPRGKLNSWIFLTQPRTTMRKSTVVDLASTQVGWYEVGATIPLPSPGHDEGRLRWLSDPGTGMELPTWAAVVGAVRRASSRRW